MPNWDKKLHFGLKYLLFHCLVCRECGWKSCDSHSTCVDPCVVCLERRCTVAAEGCFHEFCTRCALYLCSTNRTSAVAHGPPGSIACPLCRHGIVSFVKLKDLRPIGKEIPRNSLSLPFCACSADGPEIASLETPFCKPDSYCVRITPLGSSFRSLSCQRFPSMRLSPGLCMGTPDTSPSLVPRTVDRNVREHLVRCSRLSFKRSTSQTDGRSWFCSFNQCIATESSCWRWNFDSTKSTQDFFDLLHHCRLNFISFLLVKQLVSGHPSSRPGYSLESVVYIMYTDYLL